MNASDPTENPSSPSASAPTDADGHRHRSCHVPTISNSSTTTHELTAVSFSDQAHHTSRLRLQLKRLPRSANPDDHLSREHRLTPHSCLISSASSPELQRPPLEPRRARCFLARAHVTTPTPAPRRLLRPTFALAEISSASSKCSSPRSPAPTPSRPTDAMTRNRCTSSTSPSPLPRHLPPDPCQPNSTTKPRFAVPSRCPACTASITVDHLLSHTLAPNSSASHRR